MATDAAGYVVIATDQYVNNRYTLTLEWHEWPGEKARERTHTICDSLRLATAAAGFIFFFVFVFCFVSCEFVCGWQSAGAVAPSTQTATPPTFFRRLNEARAFIYLFFISLHAHIDNNNRCYKRLLPERRTATDRETNTDINGAGGTHSR